jgi:AcrR family transcriptional regulator
LSYEGQRNWALWLDFWRYAVRDPVVWEATVAPYRRFEEMFAQWLAEAQQGGALPDEDPLTAARVLLALAMGVLIQGMLLPDATDWAEVAYQGVLTLLRGWGMSLPNSPDP